MVVPLLKLELLSTSEQFDSNEYSSGLYLCTSVMPLTKTSPLTNDSICRSDEFQLSNVR